jgi:hypothetical protein
VSDPSETPLTEDEKKLLRGSILEIPESNRKAFLEKFRESFDLKPNSKVAYAITKKKHEAFIQTYLPEYVPSA